jgi:cellulose synthase/poly-beta-1,6-N-acetylglucosamine synthase-like glycosyltransferase
VLFADLAPLGTAATVWFWITLLIGVAWARRHFDLNRGSREPILSAHEPGPADLPSLDMLVAAKDEERNIARCVEGLLAQDYPQVRITIINDRSGDRTGEILDEIAARDPRVRPVHVRELPAGWFGKNNAMHQGVAHAAGDWLCFSDADCTYDSPRLLSSAMRFALREDVEFLSVLPRLETGSFWERVVQPVAGAIMVFWFPPHAVNDPRSNRAYANGAFMLMSRKAYDAIGGHEPVRATLNEDMHMARRAKLAKLRLRVIRGGDLYRVRMYTGFAEIWRGWSRIFFGCFGTLPRLLVSLLMLSIFSVGPYVTLVGSLIAGSGAAWLTLAACVTILAQQSVMWRFYSITGHPPALALTYPIGAVICLGMTLSAMRRLISGTSTTWRGTSYVGGAQT